MLDCFSGLNGASTAFQLKGWEITSVDIEKKFKPTIVADITRLPIKPSYYDFIWCSPPCTEYSRSALPWFPKRFIPNHSNFFSSVRLIKIFKPKFYCIENVKGSVPFFSRVLGNYNFCIDRWFFWTNVPNLQKISKSLLPSKQKYPGSHPLRSKIPTIISLSFYESISQYLF